jgi:hypothetical protein
MTKTATDTCNQRISSVYPQDEKMLEAIAFGVASGEYEDFAKAVKAVLVKFGHDDVEANRRRLWDWYKTASSIKDFPALDPGVPETGVPLALVRDRRNCADIRRRRVHRCLPVDGRSRCPVQVLGLGIDGCHRRASGLGSGNPFPSPAPTFHGNVMFGD